ncbi:MAG: tetratricopeptide repeat protein [Aquificaceae bacterium]
MDKLSYFLDLFEKSPSNPMVHYSLGLEYYKRGEYKRAVHHMENYIKLKEDEGAGYRILAKCYEELGDYKKAIEVLQEGIERATKYNHPSMVEEFELWIKELKGSSSL